MVEWKIYIGILITLKISFGLNVIVALNKFENDTDSEIAEIEEALIKKGVQLSLVEGWKKGAEGATDIANKLVKLVEEKENFKYIYEDNDEIEEKISKVATKIYGAQKVVYEEEAKKEIAKISKLGYGNLPICIAKTQYSFSDDAKRLSSSGEYDITVRNVELKAGAGFIVVFAGKIMTMPGLPKIPSAESIDINENGEIVGIF